MPSRLRRAPLALAALAALTLATVAIVAGCGGRGSSSSQPAASAASSPSEFDGAALPAGGQPARDFTLTDQDGNRVTLSRYRGQVTVLAFVYTTCGATCILIAQQIRGALDELPHPVPVLFISADPGADTPARISDFLAQASLTGRVHYLTGSRAALEPVWRAYRAVPASRGAVAFNRFATVILLDRAGAERVVFGLEQLTPEALAHDVRKLS